MKAHRFARQLERILAQHSVRRTVRSRNDSDNWFVDLFRAVELDHYAVFTKYVESILLTMQSR